jgi:hypothetical protein
MTNKQYTAPAFFAAATPSPKEDTKPDVKPLNHARPSEQDDPHGAAVFDALTNDQGG